MRTPFPRGVCRHGGQVPPAPRRGNQPGKRRHSTGVSPRRGQPLRIARARDRGERTTVRVRESFSGMPAVRDQSVVIVPGIDGGEWTRVGSCGLRRCAVDLCCRAGDCSGTSQGPCCCAYRCSAGRSNGRRTTPSWEREGWFIHDSRGHDREHRCAADHRCDGRTFDAASASNTAYGDPGPHPVAPEPGPRRVAARSALRTTRHPATGGRPCGVSVPPSVTAPQRTRCSGHVIYTRARHPDAGARTLRLSEKRGCRRRQSVRPCHYRRWCG